MLCVVLYIVVYYMHVVCRCVLGGLSVVWCVHRVVCRVVCCVVWCGLCVISVCTPRAVLCVSCHVVLRVVCCVMRCMRCVSWLV